jgi:NAD(P)-dependent dehydrogenase (short-subunit alcohol dehydrogenase family)
MIYATFESPVTTTKAARTALVTGGTAGIGLRIAQALREREYVVAVAGRRRERVEALMQSGFAGYALDVADATALAEAAQDLGRRIGKLDVLINAAGIVRQGALETLSVEAVREVLAANLEGTILATQAMLPLLKLARGSVVNFSTGLVRRPAPGTAVYAAAKAGIEGFTRSMALELGPAGVRVNCIAPSLVRSDIWISAGMTPARYDQMLVERGAEYPLGRVGEPQDIANLVLFMVSAQAEWITGAVIPIDGGSSLGTVKRN